MGGEKTITTKQIKKFIRKQITQSRELEYFLLVSFGAYRLTSKTKRKRKARGINTKYRIRFFVFWLINYSYVQWHTIYQQGSKKKEKRKRKAQIYISIKFNLFSELWIFNVNIKCCAEIFWHTPYYNIWLFIY